MGIYFYPRGGSAHVCRSLAREPYEDRPGAVDPVLARFDDEDFELQVEAWSAALAAAAAPGVDVLYRFACIPNGFDEEFSPGAVDRRAHWRRHLVERPRGWKPGGPPGSVSYKERDLQALDGVVLLAIGRFTEVKRLPLLIEAFAHAQVQFSERAALVLIGGHPGEWEGSTPTRRSRRGPPPRQTRPRARSRPVLLAAARRGISGIKFDAQGGEIVAPSP